MKSKQVTKSFAVVFGCFCLKNNSVMNPSEGKNEKKKKDGDTAC